MNRYVPALLLDIVAVVVFAAIGRSSHDEGLTLTGIAATAWPFVAGLTIGWIVVALLFKEKFDPWRIVPTGVIVWPVTVAVGMVVRVLVGDGTAIAFIVVATLSLAVLLLGWRAIAHLVRRPRTRT